MVIVVRVYTIMITQFIVLCVTRLNMVNVLTSLLTYAHQLTNNLIGSALAAVPLFFHFLVPCVPHRHPILRNVVTVASLLVGLIS